MSISPRTPSRDNISKKQGKKVSDAFQFVQGFVKNPIKVGALCPSSAHLGHMITSWIDLNNAKYAVEIGPGTGVITSIILKKLNPETKFFTIEVSDKFGKLLEERYPNLDVVVDSAENLSRHLQERDIPKLDTVISGIPWAGFPRTLQENLLTEISSCMAPGAKFVTYAYLSGTYLPAGRHFKQILKKYFSHVSRSPVVWRNIPPAFVYQCQV